MVERLGERTLVYCRLQDGATAHRAGRRKLAVGAGDKVGLTFETAGAHVFDADGRAYHLAEAA